jgi:hypothetical protein
VENGIGMIVTESDFRVGLSTGKYLPALPGKRPPYKKQTPDPAAIASEEYHRGFWRRAGELDCEAMFRDPEKAKALNTLIQVFQMERMSKLFSG